MLHCFISMSATGKIMLPNSSYKILQNVGVVLVVSIKERCIKHQIVQKAAQMVSICAPFQTNASFIGRTSSVAYRKIESLGSSNMVCPCSAWKRQRATVQNVVRKCIWKIFYHIMPFHAPFPSLCQMASSINKGFEQCSGTPAWGRESLFHFRRRTVYNSSALSQRTTFMTSQSVVLLNIDGRGSSAVRFFDFFSPFFWVFFGTRSKKCMTEVLLLLTPFAETSFANRCTWDN